MRWYVPNGEHIEFLKSLKERGRASALDDMPEMDADSLQMWNMFCAMGDDLLLSLDVYARRIGLPIEWDFDECLFVLANLQQERQKLIKGDD